MKGIILAGGLGTRYQSLASSIQGVKYSLNNNYFPITQKMSNQLLRLPIFVGLEVESVKKL